MTFFHPSNTKGDDLIGWESSMAPNKLALGSEINIINDNSFFLAEISCKNYFEHKHYSILLTIAYKY